MNRRSFLQLLGGTSAVALVAPVALWKAAEHAQAEPLRTVREIRSPIGKRMYTRFELDAAVEPNPRLMAEAMKRAEWAVTDGGKDGIWQIVRDDERPNPLRFTTVRTLIWQKVAA